MTQINESQDQDIFYDASDGQDEPKHKIIISNKENMYFLDSYARMINEHPELAKSTFKEHVKWLCLVDGTIKKNQDVVIKIDNDWKPEEGAFNWVKHKFWSYWDFSKTHKVLAILGGDYSDCIFVDNKKETTYNELIGATSGYGACADNEDGTNDRFKCQKIGMGIISAAVSAGFVPYSGIIGGVFGVGAGVVVGKFALDKYQNTVYPEGYINSYMGDKLAELGALALKTGVCTVDGAVRAVPLAAALAVTLGAVYPANFVLGASLLYDAIDGLNHGVEELQKFNPQTKTGKTPEAIYRESIEQATEVGTRIWPTYGKMGCAIVLGALGFAVGAFAIPALLGTAKISVIIAGIAGTILGTLGATSAYVYNKEISEFLGKAKDWLADVSSKIPGTFSSSQNIEQVTQPMNLDNLEKHMSLNPLDTSLEEEKQRYIDLIIKEHKEKDQTAKYILNQDWENIDDDINSKTYGKIIPTEVKSQVSNSEGYDPTEEMYKEEGESFHDTLGGKEDVEVFHDALDDRNEEVVSKNNESKHQDRLKNKNQEPKGPTI